MKDICGNEVKAGDMVHVWWEGNDHLCTAVRTRGRGIKLVTDDEKVFTTDYLSECNAQIAIQGSQRKNDKKAATTHDDAVTTEELDMLSKLRDRGWYGTLYKKTLLLSTFRIEMPELEKKKEE